MALQCVCWSLYADRPRTAAYRLASQRSRPTFTRPRTRRNSSPSSQALCGALGQRRAGLDSLEMLCRLALVSSFALAAVAVSAAQLAVVDCTASLDPIDSPESATTRSQQRWICSGLAGKRTLVSQAPGRRALRRRQDTSARALAGTAPAAGENSSPATTTAAADAGATGTTAADGGQAATSPATTPAATSPEAAQTTSAAPAPAETTTSAPAAGATTTTSAPAGNPDTTTQAPTTQGTTPAQDGQTTSAAPSSQPAGTTTQEPQSGTSAQGEEPTLRSHHRSTLLSLTVFTGQTLPRARPARPDQRQDRSQERRRVRRLRRPVNQLVAAVPALRQATPKQARAVSRSDRYPGAPPPWH